MHITYALALEMNGAAPLTGKGGHNYRIAVNTGSQVATLRHTLQTTLERDRMSEKIRRRLYVRKQKTNHSLSLMPTLVMPLPYFGH
jgi:hypothetical protein